jgi:hypothetical protein
VVTGVRAAKCILRGEEEKRREKSPAGRALLSQPERNGGMDNKKLTAVAAV